MCFSFFYNIYSSDKCLANDAGDVCAETQAGLRAKSLLLLSHFNH